MADFSVELEVSQMPDGWERTGPPADWHWQDLQALPPLRIADGSSIAEQRTEVRLCHENDILYVHFLCDDRDIWGLYTQRDDPIFDEEVVEVFLAPGVKDPIEYAEFEISPNGVLLDAWIVNPSGDRADMTADFSWDCNGLQWYAGRDDARDQWWAIFGIPLRSLVTGGQTPHTWRANFFRIDRPRGGRDEFSCWSPTNTDPADFHRPACFGQLILT